MGKWQEALELMEDVESLEDFLAAIAPTIKQTETAIDADSHREARFSFNVVAGCTTQWTSSSGVVPESTRLCGARADAAVQQLEAEAAQKAAEEAPHLVTGEGSHPGEAREVQGLQRWMKTGTDRDNNTKDVMAMVAIGMTRG
ncbi:hypothetical protein IscW_ISCW017949 [Ixodes scapularis]|uniref:Uncharacterized protein n=1 Tax=Ixodes scapularis TaxID=6945 RepID=B7PK92_IXOSC|nr:hypothetical protein IscW_ISCW017949 [Ixodes scapularis]|eukprot:XP_002409767.1 hypothetical protein IscW_ISCW017949 [Ixodes scapularis]